MILTSGFVFAAIPPYLIDYMWKDVEPILQRVVDCSHGELTCEAVKRKAKAGTTLVVAILRDNEVVAINTADIVDFDSGLRVMYIPITGGDYIDEWLFDSLEVGKALARDHGCTELRGLSVRKGWLRKLPPGWESITDVIKYDLEKNP
jgi:hypothetical protein